MSEHPYAVIRDWVILECRADGLTTTHVGGWTVRHHRLGEGKPYIGSPVRELDMASRSARNHAGRLVELLGDPLPMDDGLPASVMSMIDRAQRAWGLPDGTTWKRLA